MTGAVPQLEVQDLLNQTVSRLANGPEFSELEYHQLRRRVETLFKKGTPRPELGHTALVIAASQIGNLEQTKAHLKNALSLAPFEPVILTNGIAALADLGELRESLELVKRIVERYGDDLAILESSIQHGCFAMHYRFSSELLARLDKLSMNIVHPFAEHRHAFDMAVQEAEASGLSDEELLVRVESAIDTIRRNGHILRRTMFQTTYEGQVIYSLLIDADHDECARQTFAIADTLVDQYDDTGASLFSIICRPFSDYRSFGEKAS